MMNRSRVVLQIETPTMRRVSPNREVGGTASLFAYILDQNICFELDYIQ
jgi:hypothetical protein